MPFDGTASLWMPSTDLPVGRPFAITSSPDGRTIYVGCVGSGSNGVVVAIDIATKEQTTLFSGLSFVKHGMFTDADGNLYFATGGNNSGTATTTLHKWDGTSASTVWTTQAGLFGMCLGGTEVFHDFWDNSVSTAYARDRLLDGTVVWTSGYAMTFGQPRGFAATSSRVMVCNNDIGVVDHYSRSTGAHLVTDSSWADYPHGISVVSDTEAYVVDIGGALWRYDPSTQSKTRRDTAIGLPDASSPDGNYNNIHVTSEGVGFVVRGGWIADQSSPNPKDHRFDSTGTFSLTDVGIYVCDPIPMPGGWHVGLHAVRVAADGAAADNGEEAIARITEASEFRLTEDDIARIIESGN